MSCVFSFCSGFLPTKLFPLMSLQWRGWCLAAFDFFKDSVHLLEERLPKVSAELLYNIRNGETNFISFSCLPWERKAVKHESRCVHRVLCAIRLWKLGQLHLSISKGAGELRPPFWEQDVRAKAISLVKTVFLEEWIPIKWGDRGECSLWQNVLQKECKACLFHKGHCNINTRMHYYFFLMIH